MKNKPAVRGQISLIAIIIVATLAVVGIVGIAMRGSSDGAARTRQLDSFSVQRPIAIN